MRKGVKELLQKESWADYYRQYQFRLAKCYIIPLLESWGLRLVDSRVLEVGSGNGGLGAAFASKGSKVTALEIDERLVRISDEMNKKEGLNIIVAMGDICDAKCSAFRHGPFDLVIMRDVIEHIGRPEVALNNIKCNLKTRGKCFVVFPPYYSPYGAHQQILKAKRFLGIPYNKLPLLQLLPAKVFESIIRGGDRGSAEVMRISEIRMTISRFERIAAGCGFAIKKKLYYLSRPSHALRYALPVISASGIGKVPLIREVLVTAAYYLLESS